MDSSVDILRLCRLCLVKDQVNIPIFGEEDLRNIFLKISSCLPVKISKDDDLPKKICDGCSLKLDSFYEFWTSTANAQETLLSWIAQKAQTPAEPAVPKPIVNVKQETEAVEETLEESTKDETEAPPAKRPRRSAAIKAQSSIMPESDEDEDLDTTEIVTKEEIQDLQSEYTELAGSSVDEAQPGPSGLGQDGVDVEPGWSCSSCPKKFDSLTKLKFHSRVHKDKRLSCSYCDRKFRIKYLLKQHLEAVHLKEYKHNCEFCERKFTNPELLKRHVDNVHYNQFNFRCQECGQGFNFRYELIKHERFKHFGLKLTCDHCFKTFRNEQYFKEHIKTHQPDYKKDEFLCSVCSKVLTHIKSYKVHMKSHTDEAPVHICDICGKNVTSKASLRHHMRTHTGEKPFQCDACGKNFTTRNLLRTHRVVHTKEKPFGCHLCSKSFTQKGSLNIHLRQHTGEKPYVCDFCSKRFVSRTLLNSHKCDDRA